MLPFVFDFDTYCAGPNGYWTLDVEYDTYQRANDKVPRKQIITINAQHVVLDLPDMQPCTTVIHFGPDVRELTIKGLSSVRHFLKVIVPDMLRHLMIKEAVIDFDYCFDKDIVNDYPLGTTILHINGLFTTVVIQPQTVCGLTLEHCVLDLTRCNIDNHLHHGMERFVCVRMLEVDACNRCQRDIQSFLNGRTTPDSVITSKRCYMH